MSRYKDVELGEEGGIENVVNRLAICLMRCWILLDEKAQSRREEKQIPNPTPSSNASNSSTKRIINNIKHDPNEQLVEKIFKMIKDKGFAVLSHDSNGFCLNNKLNPKMKEKQKPPLQRFFEDIQEQKLVSLNLSEMDQFRLQNKK